MIEVRSLTKVLGGRPVLNGVDLAVSRGQCAVLVGPNGAGKSTLLHLVAGLSRPDRGQVLVGGAPAHRLPAAVRRRMGLLAHQPHLYEDLTGEENLRFWARIFGVTGAGRRIRELLGRFGLLLFAHDPVRTYSRGMVQRLALARVLLHDPEVLLLDEPFTGLDRAGVRLLTEVLRELKGAGRTLLLVSHRPDEVAEVADRFVLLAAGRILGERACAPGGDGAAVVEELYRLMRSGGLPGRPPAAVGASAVKKGEG